MLDTAWFPANAHRCWLHAIGCSKLRPPHSTVQQPGYRFIELASMLLVGRCSGCCRNEIAGVLHDAFMF